MKLILAICLFVFASCATRSKQWDTPDPNASANIASDIPNSRYYSAESFGTASRDMTDEEMREFTEPQKKKYGRFSGELSVGVGGKL